ncbi:hypothetical protein JOD63_001953 [Microbacterium terrae]|uniref:hypothetical protein n=1 Tax=Microbacterium terrae TaxID=69369 RepID=UPI0012EE2AB4|nr:hypothetical protein [Microbacterium terrae]MBP1077985.1 hypothetical protein [Microbacterium terrae]
MKRSVGVFVASIALVLGVAVASPAQASAPAAAVAAPAAVVPTSLSGFSAGNLMSDAVFFAKGTMTEAQIQAFLQAKVPACRSGYTCLKDWYDTSRTTKADAMCGAYSGGTRERASRIIYKVAQACGINPQVILVTLQKEQSLVLSTAPTATRYRIAMGQGCPDTAACDTRYYGFFNQVYGAAWQFKRYANPPGTSQYFTWYAPGKTWNVRYHPNTSCGSKATYIQNQATANLYYYTPYQPNAAALKAGYGTGDSCSAYGNRNFYNYFTDWFGSTQTAVARLIQQGDPVYLVSGTKRYHVQKADFPEFSRAFGSPTRVDSAYVAAFADGGPASLYLRNASTGDVSLLRDGTRHRFATCAMVAAWGSSCGSETSITSADYQTMKAGSSITAFARVSGDARVMVIEGDHLRPVYDGVTLASLNGGKAPYAALMPEAGVAKYRIGITRFASGEYIRSAADNAVYLPTQDGRLLRLRAWTYSKELGLPGAVFRSDVPASALEGYRRSDDLGLFVTCGGVVYTAAAGELHRAKSTAAAGFPAPALDASVCAELSKSSTVLGQVFIQAAGAPEVYLAQGGVYRHVVSRAALLTLTGGVWPTILTVNAATMTALPKGDPVLEPNADPRPGELVRSTQSPNLYVVVEGGTMLYVPAWAIVDEIGIARNHRTVKQAAIESAANGGRLGLFVRCDGELSIAAQGKLHRVKLAGASGFVVADLPQTTCGDLERSSETLRAQALVQGVGRNEVYLADGGVYRHVTSRAVLDALVGGKDPRILRIAPATVDALPQGEPLR